MGKRISIEITESLEDLKSLYKKTPSFRKRLRIQSLILTKQNKFQNREQLAAYLGVGVRTLYDWTQNYKLSGLDEMLKISNGGKRREVITAEHRPIIEAKLNDSTNPFKGYKDAQLWFIQEHGLEFKYQTLRTYMIREFGSKLKAPRKSHYKKDEQAIEAFKKTS
jgi:transposase